MPRRVQRVQSLGDTATSGVLAKWIAKPGDHVEKYQEVAVVETEKAAIAQIAAWSGIIARFCSAEGEEVTVNDPLLEIDAESDDEIEAATGPSLDAGQSSNDVSTPRSAPQPHEGMVLASPAVRQKASELRIPLDSVQPTGPDGRITMADLERLVARGEVTEAVGHRLTDPDVTTVNIRSQRQAIIEKMVQANDRIPHFSYVEECDVTDLEALRMELNSGPHVAASGILTPHLTPLAFIVGAVARALQKFPRVNARFDDDTGLLTMYRAVHLGVAVQTTRGLIVRVIRHAERLDLRSCALELASLKDATQTVRPDAADRTASTITVTSLGKLGGLASTPIINHPEVAIIAPNRIADRVCVHEGEIAVRKMMNLSASFDHRVVDGHEAAAFIEEVKRALEHPMALVE